MQRSSDGIYYLEQLELTEGCFCFASESIFGKFHDLKSIELFDLFLDACKTSFLNKRLSN